MASLDVFHQDPFRTITLTDAIEKTPYLPQGIDAMGVFEDEPIRTEQLMVEQRQGVFVLVPFTDRGAPGTQRTTEVRGARNFNVPRIKMEDTIKAREVAGIRAFGQETELMQVMSELARRVAGPTGLRNNLRYTQEFHKLAAVQGYLLNADGSVWYDFASEFNITRNAEIPFNLVAGVANTLRPIANNLARVARRKAQGAWIDGRTQLVALCGDAFYDALVNHPDVIRTFVNWADARAIRDGDAGVAFEEFAFGNIVWINYRGTDDTLALSAAAVNGSPTLTLGATNVLFVQANQQASGPGLASGTDVASVNTGAGTAALNANFTGVTGTYIFNFGAGTSFSGGGTIAVPSNKAILFPRRSGGIFKRALAPADSIEWVNQLGKPEYAQIIFDRDRNEWVKPELSVYPLHICTRPEVLFTATMDSAVD
jgi:hypothetical protein